MHEYCGSLPNPGIHRSVWLSPRSVFYCEYQELNESPQINHLKYTDLKAYPTCSPRAVCPTIAMAVPIRWWITSSYKKLDLPGLAYGKYSEVLAAVNTHQLLWAAWND